MLKKYFAREPKVVVVPTSNKDVIYRNTDPEVGEVPDLDGYCQRYFFQRRLVGQDIHEDQRHVLTDLIQRYPDVFTDMPEETNVIQLKMKLTDETLIQCKPLPSPIIVVKKKDGSNRVCFDFRKLNKITKVDPKPMTMAKDLFQ